MQILLNGQPKELAPRVTVEALLVELGLAPVRVAVEVNEDLVPRTTFADRALESGDRVEVVTFVGGG